MPTKTLPLQGDRAQGLGTAVQERACNSLQARRVRPEPARDRCQVV